MSSEISAHESVREMYKKLKEDGMTNLWDRWVAQEQIRCKSFCAKGLSCQFCSNGPCRIIPGKLERGACGMDGDGMAIRYMLLRNAMGLSTYTYHAREVAKTLIATGEGKTPYEISDTEKLRAFAGRLGLNAGSPVDRLAVELGQLILSMINSDSKTPLPTVEAFATPGRIAAWKKLGIIPGGPANEQIDAISHCLTNVDGDYLSLAKTAMRLALSCIYGSLIPLEYGQDILFGTPKPHEMRFDFGILDPSYVNIVVNGHEPFVGIALIEYCRRAEVQNSAKKVGAKGIRVIGSIETGQEILQRKEADEVFVGMVGNWIFIEPLIATGAVDVFAMDMNCSPPSLEEYIPKYPTTFISVSPLVNIRGVDKHIDYLPESVSSQVEEIVKLAIENFVRRKGKGTRIPPISRSAIVGFSIESILSALGGSLSPLLDAIKIGQLKGVVGLVSCTSIGNGPHDLPTVNMARELIRRDILVLSMGCGNAALQVAGLCSPEACKMAGEGLRSLCKQLGIPPVLSFGTCADTGRLSILVSEVAKALNVDVPDLPVAVTAPQYMEQKATIDAVFALAFGVLTHVSPTPPIIGGARLMKLLTEDLRNITGGNLLLENDMVKAADAIESHILAKRKALGLE
ncbi:MAG: anaerobic carbon-monoxide dehydrogenase catalytic subunit [Candidatus Methanomethylicaceae archaeon]